MMRELLAKLFPNGKEESTEFAEVVKVDGERRKKLIKERNSTRKKLKRRLDVSERRLDQSVTDLVKTCSRNNVGEDDEEKPEDTEDENC